MASVVWPKRLFKSTTMYKPYLGRNHTRKQFNVCKPKRSIAEKQKRKKAKQLTKLLPRLDGSRLMPCWQKNNTNSA
jgi:hypothetical protein